MTSETINQAISKSMAKSEQRERENSPQNFVRRLRELREREVAEERARSEDVRRRLLRAG
jgi:hypothetical protein